MRPGQRPRIEWWNPQRAYPLRSAAAPPGALPLPLPMGPTNFLRAKAAIVVDIDVLELLGHALLAHVLPFGQAEFAVVIAV